MGVRHGARAIGRFTQNGLATAQQLTTAGPSFIQVPFVERNQGGLTITSNRSVIVPRRGFYKVSGSVYVLGRTGATVSAIAYADLRVNDALADEIIVTQAPTRDVSLRIEQVLFLQAGQFIDLLAGVSGGDGNVNPEVNRDNRVTYLNVTELGSGRVV